MSDWYMSNHFQLIQYYKNYIAENPSDARAYMWLIDHMLDAGRIQEAAQYCDVYQALDHTFRSMLYQGLVWWHQGKKEEAFAYWEKMQIQFPDEWMVFFSLGDIYARTGEYEQAKKYYQKSLALQNAPKFCDPFDSIAQIYELQGNIHAAIEILNEELEVMRTDWNTSTGETPDSVRRNITRLEKLL